MNQLSYRSTKTEVRISSIQGKGLFAKTRIAAGEIVAIKGGYIFDFEEWRQVEKEIGPAEIQISDTRFIAPLRQDERDGSMLYTNHSCDPNIGIQGQIIFVAMKDIEPGEELTHDWGTTDDSDDRMECHCGSIGYRRQFHQAFDTLSRFLTLPLCAYLKDNQKWEDHFNSAEFRDLLYASKTQFSTNPELGGDVRKALNKVQQRIDKNNDGRLSDEEIQKFIAPKINEFKIYTFE